jgi:hypothetical protein
MRQARLIPDLLLVNRVFKYSRAFFPDSNTSRYSRVSSVRQVYYEQSRRYLLLEKFIEYNIIDNMHIILISLLYVTSLNPPSRSGISRDPGSSRVFTLLML